jgi:Mg-chelatase subunit ChlI
LEDIRLAAELALPHRMRRQPFTEVKLDEGRISAVLERASAEEEAQEVTGVDGVKKKRF